VQLYPNTSELRQFSPETGDEVAADWRVRVNGTVATILAPPASDCLLLGTIRVQTASHAGKTVLQQQQPQQPQQQPQQQHPSGGCVEVLPGLNAFLYQGIVPEAFLQRTVPMDSTGTLQYDVLAATMERSGAATAITASAPGFFIGLAAAGDAVGAVLVFCTTPCA
jgi:hypothetical protein